ncbi:ATP-dependent 6-phosphofructokinase [Desulfonatronovibrio magnus]|uniref:ATP-dependent 6-phosphofructokinase n=1 Tax=Desulfonatronovibrio magnus TaxID=698827 RepID=UPI0005EAEF69|nr:ATP-dependent 6-phosphofructokinase [Desulfonatronovibrio magnus]RQD61828.1 MAG: ATP-dependent 6-phosphofructokinase [Desulfonatronovibrio sp. MSAO_Bac4]
MTQKFDTSIKTVGPAKIETHLPFCRIVEDNKQISMNINPEMLGEEQNGDLNLKFEEAGPRKNLYFDPSKTKCAIVTCGGLCPGINDVIRAIVMEAYHNYNVPSVLGIMYGLQGFIPKYGHPVLELTPDSVTQIHEFGGTILASSRGPQPPEDIVDAMERMNISILFMIGGDGTMRAAQIISREVAKRNNKMSIIGVPKTIDNDVNFVSRTFGFDTAVEKATEAIRCAHTEALGAPNGIGMVKLMGRESGFIAAQATIALKEVNFVLIPESPFELHGENGLLVHLEKRLKDRGHAVIVVAEGAGQELFERKGSDPSGNIILGDICSILRKEIDKYFKAKDIEITLKFIDPSYIIRSIPANSNDRVYCGFLGQHAVHAGMSGKTDMLVSMLQDRFIYLPLSLATQKRRTLNTNSNYWGSVMASTGQPMAMLSNPPENCK